MKKTLLTILCAMTALFGMAQTSTTYNEQYVVTTNGTAASPKDGKQIVVDNGNGTISFTLENFYITAFGTEMSVGDVTIQNIVPEIGTDGLMHFSKEGTFSVPEEKITGMYAMFKNNLKNMPVKLSGKLNDEKLYAVMELESNGKIMGMALQITSVIGTDDFASGPVGEGKVYTEQLLVTIDGETSEPQQTGVTVVDNGNGTINFVLRNFILGAGEVTMPVGNIYVENLAVSTGEDGLQHFAYDGPLTIQPGDEDGDWYGPMLGEIPLKLQGKMNDEKLFVTIDIDMQATINQVVYVQLGTDDFAPAPINGKVYTEQLLVTVDGDTSEPQMTDVMVVDNGDGTINFVLKNFILSAGEESMPIGNIIVKNLAVTEVEGLQHFAYDGSLTIQPGDEEGNWYGPMLGEIPVKLQGDMNDSKLFVTIDIDMQSSLGQVIYVQLGTEFVKKNYKEPYFVIFRTLFSGPSDARTTNTVVVDNGDGTINFTLKDFVIAAGEIEIPVGDLTLHYLETTMGEDGKTTYFNGERKITIPTDKLDTDNQFVQMAIMAGFFNEELPVTIEGWYNEEELFSNFHAEAVKMGIDMSFDIQIGYAKGDVNCDGQVTIADAVSVLNAMAGEEIAGDADVNGDGQVTIADFVTVLNIMAGAEVK